MRCQLPKQRGTRVVFFSVVLIGNNNLAPLLIPDLFLCAKEVCGAVFSLCAKENFLTIVCGAVFFLQSHEDMHGGKTVQMRVHWVFQVIRPKGHFDEVSVLEPPFVSTSFQLCF